MQSEEVGEFLEWLSAEHIKHMGDRHILNCADYSNRRRAYPASWRMYMVGKAIDGFGGCAMSKPKAVQNSTPLANEQTLHTAKALIAAYKSAFGDEWAKVYAATVRISVSSYSDQR